MAQSAKQKSAFAKMIASKKGKSAKQIDPTTPFPAPKAKGTAPAGKKPMAKVDMMLMKAMPGVSMPAKKGTVSAKKTATKKGGKKC